ncbi:MAG: hypothetical protein K2X81_10705 [Candidatus Obscuribacterales bacterium]|nr:hypothetical protein [Candidatus Obscuribacterales bacterium]
MYLTSEHLVGFKVLSGMRDDLSFIVRYSWQSSQHMKEAIRILLSARLDHAESSSYVRFDAEPSEEHKEVQMRLASNPFTSEEVLDYLRKIGNSRVCEQVAANPRCPEKAMISLAKHSSPEVRAQLSENPVCPITVLYDLARDEHPDVRYCMAENPNLPLSILDELSQDENPFISARAHQTLNRSSCKTLIEGKFEFYSTAIPHLKIASASSC